MRRKILGFLLAIACAGVAQAFTFEPITQDYSPGGRDASHVFTVRNTTAEQIAVKISIRPRRIEPDGTEIQGKEAEEFVIYPRQILLDPGERRSVRVRWSGPPEIETERAYRIIAEQLPVDFGEEVPAEGASIRLTYRYEGSLYVVPPGAQAAVRVNEVVTLTSSGGRDLIVELENTGTRHTLLQDLQLKLRRTESGESDLLLETDQLQGIAGENMLAQSVRRFRIPAPPELWDGAIYAEVEYSPEYRQ